MKRRKELDRKANLIIFVMFFSPFFLVIGLFGWSAFFVGFGISLPFLLCKNYFCPIFLWINIPVITIIATTITSNINLDSTSRLGRWAVKNMWSSLDSSWPCQMMYEFPFESTQILEFQSKCFEYWRLDIFWTLPGFPSASTFTQHICWSNFSAKPPLKLFHVMNESPSASTAICGDPSS